MTNPLSEQIDQAMANLREHQAKMDVARREL